VRRWKNERIRDKKAREQRKLDGARAAAAQRKGAAVGAGGAAAGGGPASGTRS